MVLHLLCPWVEWRSTHHLLGVSFSWWVFCQSPSMLMALRPLFPWVEWCSTHHLLGFHLSGGSFVHCLVLLLADSLSFIISFFCLHVAQVFLFGHHK